MAKVLVLGGTRFFGRELVLRLIEAGHQVTIATRGSAADPFGDTVQRLVVDRGNVKSIRSAIGHADYDIVYDQLCYSPNDAAGAIEAFKNSVGRYIVTSSMAVYNSGNTAQTEDNFDPWTYSIKMGNRSDFDYAEGKRLGEAVLFQRAPFEVTAVRFPVVLGLDDYSKRVEWHIERMRQGIPFGFSNVKANTCLIHDREAAYFLQWLAEGAATGPVNACSDGVIAWTDLFSMLEQDTGCQATVLPTTPEIHMSPYSDTGSRFMNTEKAKAAGFRFDMLNAWLPVLIQEVTSHA